MRAGIYVHIWLIHFVVQQKLTQHCKATIFQLKKKRIEKASIKKKATYGIEKVFLNHVCCCYC